MGDLIITKLAAYNKMFRQRGWLAQCGGVAHMFSNSNEFGQNEIYHLSASSGVDVIYSDDRTAIRHETIDKFHGLKPVFIWPFTRKFADTVIHIRTANISRAERNRSGVIRTIDGNIPIIVGSESIDIEGKIENLCGNQIKSAIVAGMGLFVWGFGLDETIDFCERTEMEIASSFGN